MDDKYQIRFDEWAMNKEFDNENTKDNQLTADEKKMEIIERSISHDLFALKEAYTLQQIKDVDKEMKDLQARGNIDEAIALMKELTRLNTQKIKLSKELGERIILKM